MANFEFNGLDKMISRIEKIGKDAEELNGKKIKMNELFTPEFMNKNTSFSSLNEMFEAGNFNVESWDDFKNIPEDEIDKHISQNSVFQSWEEMQKTATSQYVAKKLGFNS